MREIIFLNFGNTSNYISTHFWNLNDEMFKAEEDKYNVDNSIIYDDYYNPRNLIFDYSENIRPYFISNEKLTEKKTNELEDEVKSQNRNFSEINKYELSGGRQSESNFLNLMNEMGTDDQNENLGHYEDEYNQFKQKDNKGVSKEQNINSSGDINQQLQEKKLLPSEIFKLPEDKLYDYLDFHHGIKNWNDFLQPRFHKRTFNEILTADLDIYSRQSYIKGHEFLHTDNFAYTYSDHFEDNFRKYLENCDKIELLHINVDFNSFWGGISNSIMENINDMVPKVFKVYFGTDLHSSFYNRIDDSFDVEKMLNYLWFFTDLNNHKYSNSLFMPIFKNQNPSLIKKTFDYDSEKLNKNLHDPVYDFYFSSLVGVNMHNLYMPLRSKYFNNASILNNLVHTTSSSLNFIESDILFNLEESSLVQGLKTSGTVFNFSRNIRAADFSWRKLIDASYRLNKFNSSIIHGFSDKLNVFGDKIDGFLLKHSGISYTAVDKIDLPLCYPRRVIADENKAVFLKDLSLMTNYRPFAEFTLSNLKYFPDYFKDYDLDTKKYLCNHDNGKYIEFKEKIEEFYGILDNYEYLNDAYGLRIKRRDDEEEDDGGDY